MKLSTWINKTGPKTVANLLGVDASTVYGWSRQEVMPRAKQMVRIYQITKGKVSYKDMVEPVAKNQK